MDIDINSYLLGIATVVCLGISYFFLVLFKAMDIFPEKEVNIIPWRFSFCHEKANNLNPKLPLTTSPIRFRNVGFGTLMFLGSERTYLLIRLNGPKDIEEIRKGMTAYRTEKLGRKTIVDPGP